MVTGRVLVGGDAAGERGLLQLLLGARARHQHDLGRRIRASG